MNEKWVRAVKQKKQLGKKKVNKIKRINSLSNVTFASEFIELQMEQKCTDSRALFLNAKLYYPPLMVIQSGERMCSINHCVL